MTDQEYKPLRTSFRVQLPVNDDLYLTPAEKKLKDQQAGQHDADPVGDWTSFAAQSCASHWQAVQIADEVRAAQLALEVQAAAEGKLSSITSGHHTAPAVDEEAEELVARLA